ncbi:hypothetical protein Ancab_006732 [Ancistrocladus abbreviatus]
MGKPSWILTVVTQISLCFALYLALNLGQPQEAIQNNRRRSGVSRILEIYFMSVVGGFRALKQQTLLLEQMEKAVKAYDVKFVVNIGELGKDDALLQNGARPFPLLRIPWYIMEYSQQKEAVCFLKQIELPFGKSLDIIAVNTALLQEPSSKTINDGAGLLKRMLEPSESQWNIVFGLHPLTTCKAGTEHVEIQPIYEPLHHIFTKYQVNAYFSRDGCVNYAKRGGVAYISHRGPMGLGPLSMSTNGRRTAYVSSGEMDDGFLVHRVSLLEFETYFVTLTGNVTRRIVLHQRGPEAM